MSEPVNLDLWQSAAAQGPVNLDLGASPDVATIYVATISATSQPASSDINATVIYGGAIASSSKTSVTAIAGSIIFDANLSGHSAAIQADLNSDLILTSTVGAHSNSVTGHLPADYIITGTVSTDANPLHFHGAGNYDINVYRDPAGYGGNVWAKQAEPAHHDPGISDWHMGARTPADRPVEWQEAGNISAKSAYPFGLIPRAQTQKTERYTEAAQTELRPGWLYRDLPKAHKNRIEKYAEATSSGYSASAPFWLLLPRNHRERVDQWQVPSWMDVSLQRQLIRKGCWVSKQSASFYEEAIWPLSGVSDHTRPPITPPLNIGDANLNFYRERQLNTDLEFWVDIGAARIIPIRRVYLVSNTASIVRARDGVEIPSTSVSIDYDDDSWAWQFSAIVPLISIAEALDGEEVIITINGYEWRMSVDGWSDNKSWNSQSATVTGRSRTKELSSSILLPSSYAETQDRTIIQLAEQELITGWTIDWQAADWLVPGGAWSYSNKAPMDIITELAEAAGAFVMPDRVNRHMTILPKYKTAPWHLDGVLADVQIPADIMINRGRKREYGTNANGVWLTGGNAGITARVKRTGTGAERLLADTTNALMTHVDGARALGTKLLAESLNRSLDTIELPISSADTGLILPGMILDIPDGKSYARGFKATAQKNSDHKLVVRQSIEIERPLIV